MNETSRYASVGLAKIVLPDGREVAFLRRRLVPQPETLHETARHTVTEGERLDNITATYLGDPTMFWQLCDANGALHPLELEVVGRSLRITLPAGIPAGTILSL
jgi:hypothetical protein